MCKYDNDVDDYESIVMCLWDDTPYDDDDDDDDDD